MDVVRISGIAVALGLSLLSRIAQAQDTTPFQCERLTVANTGSWAAPILRDFCEAQEAHTAQAFAKILGKPRPSTEVYLLPAYGSAEAKRTGLACVSGTAMRRLRNGWEQLRNPTYNWIRCRDL
jgi:hypothetical protein